MRAGVAVSKERGESLARSARLRRRVDYLAAQQGGRRVSSTHYMLFALPRPADRGPDGPRFGVTVTRKVGGAVVRNRVKRWVRESYRRMVPPTLGRTDLVVVARPQAADTDYATTAEELRGLLGRLRRTP